MAISFYIMPAVGAGTRQDPRRGKYWTALQLHISTSQTSEMDLGLQDTFLVAVENVNATDDTTMKADTSVIAIPTLTNTIGAGALTAVKASLESLDLPANWVTAGMTYATVLRFVAIFCQFLQRYNGLGGTTQILGGTVTLDSTFGSLAAGVQSKLQQTAASFGFNTSGVNSSTTIRALLKGMADQWTLPINIMGVNIAAG